MRVVVRVTVVVRRTDTTCLARTPPWAVADVLRWCLLVLGAAVSDATTASDAAAESDGATVADTANEAQTRVPPTAQDSAQRDSCLNFRETDMPEASCITICFSLKQRKNPCKIKSLRGFPQPDVERACQLGAGLGMVRRPDKPV